MSCAGCGMGLSVFFRLGDTELFEFLRRHNVILSEKICPKCGGVCEISSQDGSEFFFVCRASTTEQKGKKKMRVECSFQESVRVNTFFAKSRYLIRHICNFVVFEVTWSKRALGFMESQFKWSHQSVADWHRRLRAAYVDWSLLNSLPSIKVPRTVARDGARFRFLKTIISHRKRIHEIFMAIGRAYNPSDPIEQHAVDLEEVD